MKRKISSASGKSIRAGNPLTGVVASYVRGGQRLSKSHPTAQLIREIKEGLPVQELDALQSSLNLPMDRLSPMLGISKATLHRRKESGRLDQGESDRLVRFARLVGKAVEALETVENARLWLSSPQVALGGEIPLEFAETEVGAREVEDLLNRIDYGVYS